MSQSHRHLALVAPAASLDAPGADRRLSPRHPVSAFPGLDTVRLKYGPLARVIDLSSNGLQFEIDGFPLQPGSGVVVELAGQTSGLAVPATVRRCQVAGLGEHVVYRAGLAFGRPIDLPPPLALRAPGSNGGGRRGPEDELRRETSGLLRLVTDGLAQQAPRDVLLARALEWVRRSVPARIRLAGSLADRGASDASICFDAPAGEREIVRLLVDFAAAPRIEKWHLQYLQASVRLLAVVAKLPDLVSGPVETHGRPDEPRVPEGWHRLVVRYADGRLLKGFGREFTASSGYVQVWPTVDAPPPERITIPLSQVKAVFFVRDFAGDPAHVEGGTADGASHGRRVEVTFLDGETIVGTTLNYNERGIGFFLRPLDSASNNVRVFVAAGAVRHVRSAASTERAS